MKKKNKKLGQLTLFAEDSPANLSPQQEKEKAQKMTVIYGRKCYELYGKLSPLGLLVKMFLESSSMDGGKVLEKICLDLESEGYAVQPFIIPALAVGAWHRRNRIWIIAHNEGERFNDRKGPKRKGPNAKHKTTGRTIHELIPTLSANKISGSTRKDFSISLPEVIKLIPTLTARDYRAPFGDNSKAFQKRMNHPRGVNIVEFLQRENGGKSDGLKLQPGFAEIMMGFPPGYTDIGQTD
jgi:site-specific DNA-cytosine methylase